MEIFEIFQNYTNSSSKNEIEPRILSVHEGKKLLENEKKSLFKCSLCFHDFDRKDKLKGIHYLFMMKKTHSNVNFVLSTLQKKLI